MNSNTGDNNDDIEQHGSGGEMTLSKKEECTSCEQSNIVGNITEGINSVAILEDMSICASCGKEGISDDMNTCNRCKMVKYCNAACKKKHRTKHKKKCDRRVAELYDEKLFKEVEPEECPICFLPLECENETELFKSCCGKLICAGCIYAMLESEGKDLCAFCRAPPPSSDEERVKQVKRLMDKGNGEGFYQLAGFYVRGLNGMPQDYQKANELNLKAGELGCAVGYFNLGNSYNSGRGVERDVKQAKHYWELAAIGGSAHARHNLGCIEGNEGNSHRAMKHFILAARSGHDNALEVVKKGYMSGLGLLTKDEYANTLRAYQKRQKEMKSDARDKAATSGIFS